MKGRAQVQAKKALGTEDIPRRDYTSDLNFSPSVIDSIPAIPRYTLREARLNVSFPRMQFLSALAMSKGWHRIDLQRDIKFQSIVGQLFLSFLC